MLLIKNNVFAIKINTISKEIMLLIFFKSLLIGYSGAVMPGSLLTYVIDQSLTKGAKVGYLAIIGHAILETVLLVLIFLGLNKVLTSPIVEIIISFVGGGLLLFFGISGVIDFLKKRININIHENKPHHSDKRVVLESIMLSGTNPYFIIWWAGIGITLLYEAYNAFGYVGVIFFAVGHFLADLSWYMFVSIIISKTKGFLPQKIYRGITLVLSLALVGFGIRYLIKGVNFII